MWSFPAALLRYFNSRPCGRGDAVPIDINLPEQYSISIHAPAGGATYQPAPHPHQRHFNSRPCGRGDAITALLHDADLISIHAPAGGATIFR